MKRIELNRTDKQANILHIVTNWILFIAGLANLCIGTWAAASSNTVLAVTCLASGLILLFAATIDRFESLKGMGIEAKTRQLDHKIDQADRALDSLREMTELTCEALVQLQSKADRWDSAPTPDQLITFLTKVRETMQSVGSEELAINDTLKPLAKILCFDIANFYATRLQNLLQQPYQQLQHDLGKIQRPINPSDLIFLQLTERTRAIDVAQRKLREKLEVFQLEDYPNEFMTLFDDIPEVEQGIVDNLKRSASMFLPGIKSLASSCHLSDTQFWIYELTKAQKFFHSGAKEIV